MRKYNRVKCLKKEGIDTKTLEIMIVNMESNY